MEKKITQEQLKVVLDKHKKWLEREEGGKLADLEGANLSGANLSGANLEGADLEGADLRYASLRDASLRQVDLRDASLRQVDLRDANLEGANFSQANTLKVNGFYSVDNIGTFEGRVTYCKFNNTIYAGCWSGGLDDFLAVGLGMNAGNEVEMENIKMCYDFFKRMEWDK